MKRIFLFLVTNLAVMLVIGIIFNVLGLHSSLAANGVRVDNKIYRTQAHHLDYEIAS